MEDNNYKFPSYSITYRLKGYSEDEKITGLATLGEYAKEEDELIELYGDMLLWTRMDVVMRDTPILSSPYTREAIRKLCLMEDTLYVSQFKL